MCIYVMSIRIIFFKLLKAAKQTISSSAQDPKHRHLCDYPTEIIPWAQLSARSSVTNVINLEIEIIAIQSLKQSNPHRKIEIAIVVNSRECKCRSEYHHCYLLHTCTKFQPLVTIAQRANNFFKRATTHARRNIIPVRRKCSFGVIQLCDNLSIPN